MPVEAYLQKSRFPKIETKRSFPLHTTAFVPSTLLWSADTVCTVSCEAQCRGAQQAVGILFARVKSDVLEIPRRSPVATEFQIRDRMLRR
jgi:hypothetical protein